jgi:hypothetical protein
MCIWESAKYGISLKRISLLACTVHQQATSLLYAWAIQLMTTSGEHFYAFCTVGSSSLNVTKEIINQISNSGLYGPSWGDNSCSAGQEIFIMSITKTFHWTLLWTSVIQSYFFMVHFNIISSSISSHMKWYTAPAFFKTLNNNFIFTRFIVRKDFIVYFFQIIQLKFLYAFFILPMFSFLI